eukprot:GFYU01007558.1.p1 GENE.GFYU01007558.1~~GFYU01007558.1.p1  ORF type:complete len:115 (-),score=34.22 GFYU01007558.1:207-551(-)
MASNANRASLQSYKILMRAVNTAFGQDTRMLTAAKLQIREEFNKNASATSEEDIKRMVADAYEAADFIANNIVQGVVQDDKVAVSVSSEQVQGDVQMVPVDVASKNAGKGGKGC